MVNHTKKAYELMHEILTTEKLLKRTPEEFPESLTKKGRMVERLSRKNGDCTFHQFKSTKTEFLII